MSLLRVVEEHLVAVSAARHLLARRDHELRMAARRLRLGWTEAEVQITLMSAPSQPLLAASTEPIIVPTIAALALAESLGIDCPEQYL